MEATIVVPDELKKVAGVTPADNPYNILDQVQKHHPEKVFYWACDDKLDNSNDVNIHLTLQGCPYQFAPDSWFTRDQNEKNKKVFLPNFDTGGLHRVYWGGQVLLWALKADYESRKKTKADELETLRRAWLTANKRSDLEEDIGGLSDVIYQPQKE